MTINNNITNTLNGKHIVSTELYNKLLKAMDNGQVIVFHGKMTNYNSFQYAIAIAPVVIKIISSNMPTSLIICYIEYFTFSPETDSITTNSVTFEVYADPTEEVELYEPKNFDILDLSSSSGEEEEEGGLR